MAYRVRKATLQDQAALAALIALSARTLCAKDYTTDQIEGALRGAFGVDTDLIRDGTCFVAVAEGKLIGCGGWSRRKTLFGGDKHGNRDAGELDPRCDAARIRASDDFNASITANPAGQRFITWTSTDAPAGIQAQARFIGTGVFGPPAFPGQAAYTSPTFYGTAGTQRWGDYSAMTVDPADTSRAWATNEIVNTQTTWGSRIFNIGIP